MLRSLGSEIIYRLAIRDQKEEANKITYYSALLSNLNLQSNTVNLSEHAGLQMRQNAINYGLCRQTHS